MHGCTAAVLQPTVHPSYSKIYLTATLTNLKVHGPLCASCTAARTCTACPTWTIARNCTEPMQRHCKLHVGARHCTAVSCIVRNRLLYPPPFVHVDRHWKPELAPWLRHEVTTAVGVVTDRQSQLTEIGHALWAQKRPYLDKFEAPEALDRCIRILSARSSFLAWF